MLRIKIYGTGSSGNCMTLTDGDTRIMIDAGIRPSTLQKHGMRFSEIDFIFVSHDHKDHNEFAGEISTKYEIPIVGSRGTLNHTSGINDRKKAVLEHGTTYSIKSILFTPFKIVHDAHEPRGFLLRNKMMETIAFIPETGTLKNFKVEADYYILEVNHSRKLIDLAYESEAIHEALYRRIISYRGHLSYENAMEFVKLKKKSKFLFHHMSNNHYDWTSKIPNNCQLAKPGETFNFGTEVPY